MKKGDPVIAFGGTAYDNVKGWVIVVVGVKALVKFFYDSGLPIGSEVLPLKNLRLDQSRKNYITEALDAAFKKK